MPKIARFLLFLVIALPMVFVAIVDFSGTTPELFKSAALRLGLALVAGFAGFALDKLLFDEPFEDGPPLDAEVKTFKTGTSSRVTPLEAIEVKAESGQAVGLLMLGEQIRRGFIVAAFVLVVGLAC